MRKAGIVGIDADNVPAKDSRDVPSACHRAYPSNFSFTKTRQ